MLPRVAAAAGLALLLVGLAAALTAGRSDDGVEPAPSVETRARTVTPAAARPKRRPPRLRAVALQPVGAHDPQGGGDENDELAPTVVDGDLTTSWRTERYSSFYKEGVGLVLAVRRETPLARAVVWTDTPGFRAEIQVGARREGPFRAVSAARIVSGRTVFPLRRAAARYLLVWITDIPDGTAAALSEVRAFAR